MGGGRGEGWYGDRDRWGGQGPGTGAERGHRYLVLWRKDHVTPFGVVAGGGHTAIVRRCAVRISAQWDKQCAYRVGYG